MSNGPRTSLPPIVLASASPRRRELLARLGHPFEVHPSQIDESEIPGELPEVHVRRLALEKARDVATRKPGALVIGMDTVVVLSGRLLGKPDSPEEARRMLGNLSGKSHDVMTGVAMVGPELTRPVSRVAVTRVTFKPLDAREIQRYVETGEPLDKAGAYGIQGEGGLFVTGIEGCFYNVVGLPLNLLYETFREIGFNDECSIPQITAKKETPKTKTAATKSRRHED